MAMMLLWLVRLIFFYKYINFFRVEKVWRNVLTFNLLTALNWKCKKHLQKLKSNWTIKTLLLDFWCWYFIILWSELLLLIIPAINCKIFSFSYFLWQNIFTFITFDKYFSNLYSNFLKLSSPNVFYKKKCF